MANLKLVKKLLVSVLAFPFVLFAQENNPLSLSADALWCEGRWVTITASAIDCEIDSIQWSLLLDDGNESSLDISTLFALEGNNLKSRTDGRFIARTACVDGRQLEGIFELLQELDTNCLLLD